MAARSIRAYGPFNFSTELRASGGIAVRSCVVGIRARADPFSQGAALLHFFYPNRRAGELLPGRPECLMPICQKMDYPEARAIPTLHPRCETPKARSHRRLG